MIIRPMQMTDLDDADRLRQLAGWNQTRADWVRFLDFHPPGCFVAQSQSGIVGSATTIDYGHRIAWIGMLLVHPDFRGRGTGRALLERCITHLQESGVPSIMLDATPQGQPLYEKLGFKPHWQLNRWELGSNILQPIQIQGLLRVATAADLVAMIELDRLAFGIGRSQLITSLLEASLIGLVHGHPVDGFGLLRRGSRADYIGPVTALSESAAASMVAGLLQSSTGRTVFWDIPEPNPAAEQLAHHFGFVRQRPLLRMVLGDAPPQASIQSCFAIADPALG